MKRFRIVWKYPEQYGTSEVEAETEEEALLMAEEGGAVNDFGDPDQFEQEFTVDDVWNVYTIEEISMKPFVKK